MKQRRITDDLHALLNVLPSEITQAVVRADHSDRLLEIVMDLGRIPMARFLDGEVPLLDHEITRADLDYVTERIGDFDADNRAGMERTLHRISAIRNRRAAIVGLTCRVGRAVYGTLDIIEDLVKSGQSILILGKPGIGKTTMLREAARVLAETQRVVIVDTSNEIGGDGDVPHPAVGRARRMQVAMPSLQHEVMIEAVENHNPEVVVIDEIGRELEAQAARTIAERGVQLIGTAHGRTLENLLLNPTLADLVGGIESVTLSDEEARRRGTQKTVLERRAPPTFDVLIEIIDRDRLVVHPDVSAAVDALVRGFPLQPQMRYRDEQGEVHSERAPAPVMQSPQFNRNQPQSQPGGYRRNNGGGMGPQMGLEAVQPPPMRRSRRNDLPETVEASAASAPSEAGSSGGSRVRTLRIFPYGVARNRLAQAAKRLGVPAVVVREPGEAEVLMTLRPYYRSRQQTIIEAEERGMPIYVLRANTVNQMEQSLAEMFNVSVEQPVTNNWEDVTDETQAAISAVLNGQRWVDLPPANAAVRRIQHELARQAELVSHSYGKDPNRRVRIFRE